MKLHREPFKDSTNFRLKIPEGFLSIARRFIGGNGENHQNVKCPVGTFESGEETAVPAGRG